MKTPATAIRALVLVAAFAALLVLAAPAMAAPSCGRAVIDDWSDGRIDKQYPLHCYDDAIEMLPRDVRDYSSAEEDMRRALQAAMRGQDAPPNRDSDSSPDPVDEPQDPDTPVSSDDPDTDTTETTGAGPTDGDDGGGIPEAAPTAETESASSVPIPLLILAGLALLLVAGGTAGYVIRRVQARRVPRTTA